jgi:Tfp pilus assembly protein PilW
MCTAQRAHSQTGVTLVELLISASFGVLILAFVGGFLVSALTTQRFVMGSDLANEQTGILSRSLRNNLAKAPIAWSYNTETSQSILSAPIYRRVGTQWTWGCRAWVLQNGKVYTSYQEYNQQDLPDPQISVPHELDGATGWSSLTTATVIPGAASVSPSQETSDSDVVKWPQTAVDQSSTTKQVNIQYQIGSVSSTSKSSPVPAVSIDTTLTIGGESLLPSDNDDEAIQAFKSFLNDDAEWKCTK